MATRIPLILNQATARIEELAAADTLPGSAVSGFLGKNRLINGNIAFTQRGNSGTVQNAAVYTADRWRCSAVGGSASNWGVGGHAVGEVPDATRYLGFNVVSGTTSAWIGQHIEGVETLAGREVTISFYMRSNVAGKKVGVTCQQIFGTAGSSLTNVDGGIVTLGTAFQKFSVTLTLPSIAGKTIGTNNNVLLVFWLCDTTAHGGQLAGQVGLFEISSMQLEEGAAATAFDMRSQALELLLCQRYYQKSFPVAEDPANNSLTCIHRPGVSFAATAMRIGVSFTTPMRASPSMKFFMGAEVSGGTAGRWGYYDPGAGAWRSSTTAPNVVQLTSSGFTVDIEGTGLAFPSSYLITGQYTADAEI